MNSIFVGNMVEIILKIHGLNSAVSSEQIATFIGKEIAKAPDYMRIALVISGWTFNNICVLFYGKTFKRLAFNQQVKVIHFIQAKNIPLFGLMVRLYESLTLVKALERDH